MNIRVFLVDDQPAIRQGLRLRLTAEPDLTVVGEAADGQEALELAPAARPDVIVLDIAMPGMDGFETARRLLELLRSAIVILSLHDDATSRARALAAGATTFVAKHEANALLIDAIRSAAPTRGGP